VLHKVGILGKNYHNYSSWKLQEKFKLSNISPEIGDLVFYDGGYVFFYLGNNYLGDNVIMGMTTSGIVILRISKMK